MKFPVEKFVSNFVQSQFPAFYQEEGPDFILFMKAYYEWMEEGSPDGHFTQPGGPISEARDLLNYRDIDQTLTQFLEYFQKKYLYGIPFNVIANKRFLLKHILDVYRSKGTIQCYRLLFKLLYNQDIDIYLPGRDVLKPSDGTWVQPKYLEVTDNDQLQSLIGQTIIGSSSKTTAVVENFVKESHNNDVINILYLSNILPRGGNFEVGEKIVFPEDINNSTAVSAAPRVLGSLDSLNIINGGQGFNIGDIIKIAYRDLSNNDIISYGTEGLLKVTGLSRGFGSLFFDVVTGGFGYMANAETFVYKNSANGQGASFTVGAISSTQEIQYNTDLICDYANLTLDTATYGFPANTSANLTSNIGTVFSYTNNVFGTILNLGNIKTGNGYDQPANVFVRSVQTSDPLQGTISYNTTSNTITGTGTTFNWIYQPDDVIFLQSNSSLSSTIEYQVIKTVTNATSMVLYGPPSLNSTASAQYRAAPAILPSNFAVYDTVMQRPDNTINGLNEVITASPSSGNNVVGGAIAVNSGRGYVDGEIIKAYLYGAISNNVTILNPGSGYTNSDVIIFSGGSPGTTAAGYVLTNSNGSITSAVVTQAGSGYTTIPTLAVRSSNGTGAALAATLTEFNTTSEITARVVKSGIGKGSGYWSTTRSFLNSDKYIQDSEYYQDYSYEIRVAETLNKYRNILYNTFHTAGSELFGKYLLLTKESSTISILYEDSVATIS